jgi:hypothetical protein
VLDQSTRKKHIVTLLGEWSVPDFVAVDAVRDDLNGFTGRANRGEPISADRRDRYQMLGYTSGEVLGDLAERGEVTEIVLPVVAPDLVPGGD